VSSTENANDNSSALRRSGWHDRRDKYLYFKRPPAGLHGVRTERAPLTRRRAHAVLQGDPALAAHSKTVRGQ
jgi:hypothetical protein